MVLVMVIVSGNGAGEPESRSRDLIHQCQQSAQHDFGTTQSPYQQIAGQQSKSLIAFCRRQVKFQSVNILSIFIEDNQKEEETTQVQKIVLYGSAGETMNVNEIKKVGEENS
jgi:hypothetical protein